MSRKNHTDRTICYKLVCQYMKLFSAHCEVWVTNFLDKGTQRLYIKVSTENKRQRSTLLHTILVCKNKHDPIMFICVTQWASWRHCHRYFKQLSPTGHWREAALGEKCRVRHQFKGGMIDNVTNTIGIFNSRKIYIFQCRHLENIKNHAYFTCIICIDLCDRVCNIYQFICLVFYKVVNIVLLYNNYSWDMYIFFSKNILQNWQHLKIVIVHMINTAYNYI